MRILHVRVVDGFDAHLLRDVPIRRRKRERHRRRVRARVDALVGEDDVTDAALFGDDDVDVGGGNLRQFHVHDVRVPTLEHGEGIGEHVQTDGSYPSTLRLGLVISKGVEGDEPHVVLRAGNQPADGEGIQTLPAGVRPRGRGRGPEIFLDASRRRADALVSGARAHLERGRFGRSSG